MPENLRITAPVPNSDGILKPNPSSQPPTVEPMEPAQVNRPNAQNQNTDSASLNLLLRRDSVFGEFIQQLRQTPALSETLSKLLFNTVRRMETAPESLLQSSLLRQLTAALATGRDDVVKDLLFQQKNSSLFCGPLFQLLGRISEQAENPQMDLQIANFLKSFDGFFSAKDTTAAILSNLKAIGRQIPGGDAKQLTALAEKLNVADPVRSVEQNLTVLKKEILPFLAAYVSKSSDYGQARETISLLLQNISILNVSSRENLDAQFQKLAAYCGHHLSEPMLRQMRSLYEEAVRSENEEPENRFFHALISLLSHDGREIPESDRTLYADISQSLLLDNSVYMPFVHFFLPAVLGGKYLFSQIWIEKKEPGEARKSLSNQSSLPTRLYLTFDIQDLGSFEARIELLNKKVNLDLACPEKLLQQSREITSSLGHILTDNGLASGNIRISRCEKPKIPDLILQKVMERKRMIDVTI